MKYIFKFTSVIISALLLILATIISLGYSTAGTITLLNSVNFITPGRLSFADIKGNLLQGFTAENIQYKQSNIDISIKNISFSWDLINLLKGELKINQFSAANIKIDLTTETQSLPKKDKSTFSANFNNSFKINPLPFSINIQKSNIHNLLIKNNNKKIICLEELFFSGKITKKNIYNLKLALIEKENKIAINGSKNDSNINMEWKIDLPKLNLINQNMQGKITSQGKINGPWHNTAIKINFISSQLVIDDTKIDKINVNIDGSTLQQKITTTIIGYNTQIKMHANSSWISKTKTWLLTSNLSANNINNHQALADLNIKLEANHLNFLNPIDNKTRLKGTLNLTSNNLSILKDLIPDIENASGVLTSKINLSGSATAPKMDGYLKLNNGRIGLQEEKINITNINLDLLLQNTKAKYTAIGHSGEGYIKLTGETNYINSSFKSKADIQGQNFLAYNTAQIHVYASPKISLEHEGEKLKLQGSIFIPKANISMPEVDNIVTLPKETVFIEENHNSTSDLLNIYSHIELILGDDVNINIKGLKGRLAGQLKITDTPTSASIANGKIILKNSSFSFYGQELQVKHARAYFTNSLLINPSLNLAAQRTIKYLQNDLNVGVTVTGTAEDPIITLFSNPAGWSQTDIMSLLLFGQPVENISKDSTAILMRAVQALASTQGNNNAILNLTNQIKNTLGLSELSFETRLNKNANQNGSTQSTALVLGKQLNSKIDINYSSDLINDLNVLKIRYKLSDHWTAQSQNSIEGSGVDILYSIEK